MTYNVFGRTLNLAQLIYCFLNLQLTDLVRFDPASVTKQDYFDYKLCTQFFC